MDWSPNVEGIRWFLDAIWPAIHAKFPELKLYLAGRNMKGENLSSIGSYFDSVMTYYDSYGITNSAGYNSIGIFVEKSIKPINDFFAADLADTNFIIDTNAVKVEKNGYAIKLLGVKVPTDSGSIVNPPSEKSITQRLDYSQIKESPKSFDLQQNYPNPFNPTTCVPFHLSQDAVVTLKVYNVLGQEITTIIDNEEFEAGTHEANFDASNISSGMYFYRLTAMPSENARSAKTFISVKKMMLVK